MMTTREAEIEEYAKAYQDPEYKMGVRRKSHVESILERLPVANGMRRGTLLDIGAGRGETLAMARELGYIAIGTEVVPDLINGENVVYAEAHKLPFDDKSYDHVTMFDVIEHLVPDDTEQALNQMIRVAKISCTVSCSTEPSIWNGRELHINKRTKEEWAEVIEWCWGPKAKHIGYCGRSECFQVVLF